MTDTTKRPLKVFLCHASADKPAVRKLYRYLRAKGMDPWLDAEKLLPGQRWEAEIPKALYASDAIIVFLSKNSTTKEGYVQREIKFALDKALDMPEGRIFLIPARLEECELPESLKGYQWMDLFQKNWNRRLMSSLNERVAQLGLTPLSTTGETQPPVITTPVMSPASHAKLVSPEVEETSSEVRQAEVAKESQPKISFAQSVEIIESNEPVELLTNSSETRTEMPVVVEKELGEKPKGEVIVPVKRSLQSDSLVQEKEKILANRKSFRLLWTVGFALICLIGSLLGGNLVFQNLPNLFDPASSTNLPTNPFTPTITSQPSEADTPSPTQPSIHPTPMLRIGSTIASDKDGMTLLYVPAGEFTMGSDNGASDEKPVHQVTLDAFWIDQTEVTNAMYAECVDANQCNPPSKTNSYTHSEYFGISEVDNYPVIYVSWRDALAYCSWAGRRLPTEAEWEKAARGTNGNIYPWGNIDPKDTLLNFNSNVGDTTEVGAYPMGASIYGAYDMAGNVWEWVNDWYGETYYQGSPLSNPSGPDSGQYRVLRGGSWVINNSIVRAANRGKSDPTLAQDYIGFRCAMSASP